ncbi:PTS sugar transporter subunit IIA [Candidatus Sumerlaeota bacterium]|nr:PTS sugar transporter subunit IIA [Candidatus Sumerlaeota bacterium]
MNFNEIPFQLLSIGVLLVSALLMGKLFARLGVGEITGQILGGVLVNPSFLHWFGVGSPAYHDAFASLKFMMFAIFSLTVFALGEEMSFERVRKAGRDTLAITLVQILVTFVLVLVLFLLFGGDGTPVVHAFIIATVGLATAPVALFILIKRMGIEGDLRIKATNIVVVSNVVQIVLFSICIQFALDVEGGESATLLRALARVTKEIALSLAIGAAIFLVLKTAIRETPLEPLPYRSDETTELGFLRFFFEDSPTPSLEVLLLVFGLICAGAALAWTLGLPFLITSLAAGMLVANFHSRRVFDSLFIGNITPILNLVFFALVGASLRLETYSLQILFYVFLYVVGRGAGKFFGTWLGCKMTRQDPKIAYCLPMLMLPQAGLAAVQVAFISFALPQGERVFQIVIPGMIVFEVGGILVSERALRKWKSWVVGEAKILRGRTAVVSDDAVLTRILTENDVIVPLSAHNKAEVLNEMLGRLVENEHIAPQVKHGLFREFLRRERIQSTGIGDGVAIPHIRTALVDKMSCVLGIKRDHPVEYKAIDDKPVSLVFLFLSPEKETGNHLRLLSEISYVLRDAREREILLGAGNASEAYRILTDYCKTWPQEKAGSPSGV